MERIPLRSGKSTPEFVENVLAVFGNNPYGEPNYRLIWSERKMFFFAGEVDPEYQFLNPQCWVLEAWTAPGADAGAEALWDKVKQFLLGPYPRKGTYNFVQAFPSDWYPNEQSVRLIAKGLMESRDIPIKQREQAIRENLEHTAKKSRQEVADSIVELQDSASLGKIQQPASGQKNTFRTPDDYGRDLERATPIKVKNLPHKGGKILKGDA